MAQFAAAHLTGRIANRGLLCQAKRLPEPITIGSWRCCGSEAPFPAETGAFRQSTYARSGEENIVLGLVQPVERMQRAHREFGIGGVDQNQSLISDVVMARMLILRSDRALKAWAATPAWLRMPLPITETLATSVALSSRA